ncbi:MAG: HNH endonuclease [Methanobrevibacter sp.]|jgi:5-methylcytosine-specific restriction protein A|nr:HNH endonuclease [Methanobrevibacter sp.]
MRKYLCRAAGCQALLDSPGLCSKHYKEPVKPFENAVRSNDYNTTEWKKLRREHLKYNNECIVCGNREHLEVDHIICPVGNEELFYDSNNLQTLCSYHHKIKTAKEIRERKNK